MIVNQKLHCERPRCDINLYTNSYHTSIVYGTMVCDTDKVKYLVGGMVNET